MKNTAKVGKRIQWARKKKQLQQGELAQKIGITTAHLSHIENGKVFLSIKTLLLICNELEVTPNDLLLEEYCLSNDSSLSYMREKIIHLTPDERTFVYETIRLLESMHLNKEYFRNKYQIPSYLDRNEKVSDA